MEAWQIEAEKIIRDALQLDFPPEMPLYILRQCDVARAAPPKCWGFASPTLDLRAKAVLQDAGRWRGRGHAVSVDDAAIVKCFAESGAEELGLPKCIGTTLHEIAHCLEFAASDSRSAVHGETDEALEAACVSLIRDYCDREQRDAERAEAEALAPKWFQHPLPFWRAVMHVAHRLELAGYRLGQPDFAAAFVAEPKLYGLSDFGTYHAAAFWDLWRTGEPIAEVLKSPPCESLQELWDKDTAAFFADGEKDSGVAAAACVNAAGSS